MTTIFSTGSWISAAWDAGAGGPSGGMMGALQGASSRKYKPGSIKAYIHGTQSNALALNAIAQNSMVDRTMLMMQAGDAAMEKRMMERIAQAEKQRVPMVQAKPLGDSIIYFENGSVLDTEKNILTLSSGKKIDALTGADWVDPASIINLANGSYLDTANNILTLADGTKVNTITGLTV